MAKTLFRGFSTADDAALTRNWTLYDIELIKRDLHNHFHTIVGERVMRPEFGCRIWDYLFEPLNAANRDAIVVEATRICEADRRVAVVSVDVTEGDNAIRIEVVLNYIPLKIIDTFRVDFERRDIENEAL